MVCRWQAVLQTSSAIAAMAWKTVRVEFNMRAFYLCDVWLSSQRMVAGDDCGVVR
jgi:hypothetical protein